MNRWKIVWRAVFGISLSAGRTGECHEPPKLEPPKATPIPKQLEKFGQTRVDNYYWLKERTDPKGEFRGHHT
jgi:oligopeptidase B